MGCLLPKDGSGRDQQAERLKIFVGMHLRIMMTICEIGSERIF